MIKSLKELGRPKFYVWLLVVMFFVVAHFPVDSEFYQTKRSDDSGFFVTATDKAIRFTNPILQFAIPIAMRDPVGFVQSINASLFAAITSHGLKIALNNQYTIDGKRRLGERPNSPNSKHNMPSGHSDMSAIALFFITKRYGYKTTTLKITLLFIFFVLISTMYARVMLDAHTISATIAGAALGLISVLLFVSYKKD